ncbi:hypothetical protein QLX08_010191 [Tetragonisca angustula]|uniref:Uncharacterized protein n=1 Tax=Tetragonisca angustula TaxID=166442 RepID=A0AAW0ZD24_9HYME
MGRKKMNTKSTNTESQMASGSNAVGVLWQIPAVLSSDEFECLWSGSRTVIRGKQKPRVKRTGSFSKFNLTLDCLENNVTGLGEVEALRPSVKGMTGRIPSTLLSVDHNSEQAGSRVCSADRNTGKNVDKPDFELIVPVNDAESNSSDWTPALNQKGKKGNKRAHKSSSEEMREKEIERKSTTTGNLESGKEVDYIVNIESSLPPGSKAAKPLPSQQELAEEMKLMTAVNVFLIICKTKAKVGLPVGWRRCEDVCEKKETE